MRRALPLLLLVACADARDAGEQVAPAKQAFTSVQATPLDFELDGKLVTDTEDPGTVRTLIETQLLFTIGQLNADQSVGRLGLLQLSDVHATKVEPPPDEEGEPPPPYFEVSYHAKLPVAWAGAFEPETYTFTLPARVAEGDQRAFASKYGATCVDPTEAPAQVGNLFAVYRPKEPGCALDAGDVVSVTASVAPSTELSRGKYPEYRRVWQDGELHAVAIFTREFADGRDDDGGARAYDDFVWHMHEYLGLLQPDEAKRHVPRDLPWSPSAAGASSLRLAADLPDGRSLTLDMRLVNVALASEGPAFDAWYDGVTPSADLVMFNGHAGLGSNVRSLMAKGSFRSSQYLVWFANGCDTLAYVDRTLTERRAPLNPDDPAGTKYLDTVTNVMAGYFGDLEATAVTFLRAFVEVRYPEIGPKTYEQILGEIDPTQVAVVTGEEDNVHEPLPPGAAPPGPPPGPLSERDEEAEDVEVETTTGAPRSPARARKEAGGCALGAASGRGFGLPALAFFASVLAFRQRPRRERRSSVSSP